MGCNGGHLRRVQLALAERKPSILPPLPLPHNPTPPHPAGTSHEWVGIDAFASDLDAAAAFSNIFSALGAAPLLRVGGHSQETLPGPPPERAWAALAALKARAGARFIVGLPLEQRGSGRVAAAMMADARRWLGEESIIAFELGNEPGEGRGAG